MTRLTQFRTRPARRAAPKAAETASRIIARIAKKGGFADARLVEHWREILGDRLAEIAAPVDLTRKSGEGVLTIRVANGAAAAHIQHRAPQILERINRFYGWNAAQKLRIVQRGRARGPARKTAAALLGDGLKTAAAQGDPERAAAFSDPEIGAAFARLGARIRQRR
ncbi:MAG: DciA family protein [Parvularculaceae bacterium]